VASPAAALVLRKARLLTPLAFVPFVSSRRCPVIATSTVSSVGGEAFSRDFLFSAFTPGSS
jgi:hypothetical protein